MRHILILLSALVLSFSASAQSWELNRIKSLIKDGKYLDAAKQLRPLADGGNAEAQYIAAGLFSAGKGVNKSDQQAEKYYQMAARQMYEPAILEMADFYIARDQYAKAYSTLRGAAERDESMLKGAVGFALAKLHLGGMVDEDDFEEGKKLVFDEADPEEGWKLLVDLIKSPKGDGEHHLEYDDYLLSVYKGFFQTLIDSGFKAGQPATLVQKLAVDYGSQRGHALCSDYAIQYYIGKLQNAPDSVRTAHFKAWTDKSLNSSVKDFVYPLLIFEGLGSEKNIRVAKNLARAWTEGDLKAMSYMSSRRKEILSAPDAPAVEKPQEASDDVVASAVEGQDASFPGGSLAMEKWINQNMKYPSRAKEDGIQGRVTVAFAVEPNGSIVEAKIAKSVDPLLDREALRIVQSMPKWIPAKKGGRLVKCSMTVPITFRLK